MKGTMVHTKIMLLPLGVQLALASATLMFKYATIPEELETLQPFLHIGVQVLTLLGGSVIFVLIVSNISSEDMDGEGMASTNAPLIPLEISFRGPKAEEAYRQALKHGQVEVHRGRIMLIGQDGAGKTSLKKSLLGLSFDPREQSTDGVVVDPSIFSVDVDDAVDWKISKTSEVNINNFEDVVASVMADSLNQSHQVQRAESTQSQLSQQQENDSPKLKRKREERHVEGRIAEKDQPSEEYHQRLSEDVVTDKVQDAASASIHHGVESSHDTLDKNMEENKEDDTEMENPARNKDAIPETVMENLIRRLSAKQLGASEEQETTVSIWDFAGQQLYYTSHPVFFSHRAVYVLVYNLKKNILAEAEPCVRQGVHERYLDNHDHQTSLEALLSWLVSIHSARPEARDADEILPYFRPPVIIVGTHADCPYEEPKKMEEDIQKNLTRQSYDQHVVRPFIRVNNRKSSNDDGVKKLKEKVKELFRTEPYMGEKVPVHWIKFEKVIKSLVEDEGRHHMLIKDLERLILEVCDIEDKDEIMALLNFYHDLGVIVKHGNTVVLKAEWLIDLFRKFITVRPYDDQNPVNSKHWTALEETGILNMQLVENVFKDQINCGETKDDILAMMEHYALIARFGGYEDPKSFHYFVPSQLKSSPEAFFDVAPSKADPCTLYLHFLDGFIPHGLYNCLVSRMITWCSEKGYPHEPKLYQSVSRFFIGCTYRYELFLIRRKRFVKVVLRSLQEERSWVFKPVAFQIRKYLETSLKEMTEKCLWYQSLNYKVCVRCPSRHVEPKCKGHQLEFCNDDDCLHLLPIEEDRQLVCRESIGDESKPEVIGLDEWYREHPMSVFVRPTNMDKICLKDRPDQTDVYKMTSHPRGVVLIVNIEHFNIDPKHRMYGRLNDRVGSKKDKEDVTFLFRHLDFNVETINDEKTSATKLLLELHKISTDYDFSAFDCFVLFIMSHGEDGIIYAKDGKGISPGDVVSLFWSSKCKSLAGKPKLFFFQTCRGRRLDSGVPLCDAPGNLMEATTIPTTSEPNDAGRVPKTADILEFYSSYTGFVSYIHPEEGSPFIQAIVEVFREYACQQHILELITKVKERVSKGEYLEKKQMPHNNGTLTKKLYFWPGVEF